MASIKNLVGQVEIECHADKFFQAWVHNLDDLTRVSPDTLPNVVLHEGAWQAVGSRHTWDYVINGEKASITIITEEIDHNSKSVRYRLVDGQMMRNHYKDFTTKVQVIPKGEKSVVKWTFEYEKMNENAPEPHGNMELMLNSAKDLDAHLCA